MPEQEPQPQSGASELAAFGEDLRREREIRGISLKEIADATKISRRFLEALERNDHRTLPAPVFTRGFVREYARYVGLNADELVNRYNLAVANDDRIEKPPQFERYPATPVRDITPKPKPKRGLPPPWAQVNRNALSLFALTALLAAVAYWAIQHRRPFLESEVPARVPLTTRAALPPVGDPVALTPVAQDDTVLRLTIDPAAEAWIDLEADGERVLRDTLAAGETRTFEATDGFQFRTIGNASAVTLSINGVTVPPFGRDVVSNRRFDREWLRQARAAEPRDAGDTATATSP